MICRVVSLGLTFGFAFFAVTVTAADADKPADWSAWSPVAVWTGEVSKLSRKAETGFTVRVGTPAAPVSGKTAGTAKAQTKSYELLYADGALVRWAKLPQKLDDKGKPVTRTPEELADLKKPAGAKGYAAARTDLKPGMVVEVTLVRPKELAAKEVQFSDYRIKQVLIVGENPNAADSKAKEKDKAKK